MGFASKVIYLMAVVFGLLLPLIHWADREQVASAQGRVGPRGAGFIGDPLWGLLQPLADLVKWLVKQDGVPEGARALPYRAAPVLALTAPFVALAVIPFAGRYSLGSVELNGVVADLDWGVLWLLVAASVGSLAAVAAAWSTPNTWAVLGGVRAIAQTMSTTIVLGFSFVGLFMVFGSARPSDIVVAQDATFEAFAPLAGIVPGPWGEWLAALSLPRWGLLVQPLAFAVFTVGGLAQCRRDPFDAPHAESELLGGNEVAFGGIRSGFFLIASHLRVVMFATFLVSLFLGGWSIPYASADSIIGSIAPTFGRGLATLVCAGIHAVAFWVKVWVVIAAVLQAGSVLPRLRYDQLMSLCWRRLMPLALLNVFLTAAVLQLLEGLS